MMKGNKGEVAELYVFLTCLEKQGMQIEYKNYDGIYEKKKAPLVGVQIPIGDTWIGYRLIKVVGNSYTVEIDDYAGNVRQVVVQNLSEYRLKLLHNLNNTETDFQREEKSQVQILLPSYMECFLNQLGVYRVKASSRNKMDLGLVFEGDDPSEAMKVSIKCQFGASPTLGNVSGHTWARYEVELKPGETREGVNRLKKERCKRFSSMKLLVGGKGDAYGFPGFVQYGMPDQQIRLYLMLNAHYRMYGAPKRKEETFMQKLIEDCYLEAINTGQKGVTIPALKRAFGTVAKYYYIGGTAEKCTVGKISSECPQGVLDVKRDGSFFLWRMSNEDAFHQYLIDHCRFDTPSSKKSAERCFRVLFDSPSKKKLHYKDSLLLKIEQKPTSRVKKEGK